VDELDHPEQSLYVDVSVREDGLGEVAIKGSELL